MLVEGEGDVLLLPATTRYESPGGGTETSTERRIIFSPEIPGRRVGSARPEWQVFGDVMARVHPGRANQVRFESAAAIRAEIERAVPLYAGIGGLRQKGDQVQWGGPTLYADGRFATSDGKAHFSPVVASRAREVGGIRVDDVRSVRLQGDVRSVRLQPDASPDGPLQFRVSTRRGKQFNSMVQRHVDPLTGAARDEVFISREDLARVGLAEGARVRLRSPGGSVVGRLKVAPMRPGNLEVHWPEGNALLGTGLDPDSMEPDYNALVTIERVIA
jgi:anaerobic selenocysteine-containing dehydrogenase